MCKRVGHLQKAYLRTTLNIDPILRCFFVMCAILNLWSSILLCAFDCFVPFALLCVSLGLQHHIIPILFYIFCERKRNATWKTTSNFFILSKQLGFWRCCCFFMYKIVFSSFNLIYHLLLYSVFFYKNWSVKLTLICWIGVKDRRELFFKNFLLAACLSLRETHTRHFYIIYEKCFFFD